MKKLLKKSPRASRRDYGKQFSKKERRISKSLTIVGLIFVLIGLIGNEWILARLVNDGGPFSFAGRLIVWIVDLVLVGLGVSLIYFRKNVRIQINLALLFWTLVVCLLIAEGVLSLTGFGKQEELKLFRENPNRTGSYRLKPDLDITTEFRARLMTIRTNSHGMRWSEVSYDKPLETERIAFVGDSSTFGVWADKIENSFVGIFDPLMDSKKFEVLNFGVPGYGLMDMELQIKEQVLFFKPDYIISWDLKSFSEDISQKLEDYKIQLIDRQTIEKKTTSEVVQMIKS